MKTSNEISDKIKDIKDKILEISTIITKILEIIPNIPDDDVPTNDNQVVNIVGHKPQFNDNKFLDHMNIAKLHNLIDYERGVKISGNGHWIYKNKGAIIEWALINYFIQTHINNNYEFILPPHMLLNKCGYIAGQFPKFMDETFQIQSNQNKKFLIPTSETILASMHENEIFKEYELPKKYFTYTPCYRKEIGSYRTSERGMIRGHQFNKVETFQITKPEESKDALDELINISEEIVKDLGLHYRISKMSAKNCSFAMAKTYDIEVWIPSINNYKEVSSCSNAKDYQARRGNIKFKGNKKNEYVHTLNASSLATSRIFPAILETYQQSDGSILIPQKLKKFLNFDKITKN